MPDPRLSLLDRLRAVSEATSARELDTVCADLIQRLGFPFFAAHAMPAPPHRTGQFIFGNAPAEWRDDLADLHCGWLRQWSLQCSKSPLPFCWDEPLRVPQAGSSYAPEKTGHSLVYGSSAIVVTNRRSSVVMSLMRAEEALPAGDHERYDLLVQTYFLANITMDAWERVEKRSTRLRPLPQAPNVLTPRERQCLTLAAEGDTSTQIAARLGISKRTAAFHVDRAIRRLQVHSRAAAVKQAILMGQITPALAEGDVRTTVGNCRGNF
jgi:DNA-binding CsgD family transcriptional regulator